MSISRNSSPKSPSQLLPYPSRLKKSKANEKLLILAVSCAIEGFEFTFVQCLGKGTTKPKRILKVSAQKFPSIVVPMVGNITDLLGELYYLYVDDASKTGGITREEASHINQMLVTDDLLFKETKKDKKPADVVIAKGSHFVVATQSGSGRNVVIDYVVNAVKEDKAKKYKLEKDLITILDTVFGLRPYTEDGPSDSWKDPLELPEMQQMTTPSDSSMAPLPKVCWTSVYQQHRLQICRREGHPHAERGDPTGPDRPSYARRWYHSERLNSLPDHIELSLEGLAAEFNKPPVAIAGLFRKPGDSYRGGTIISMNAYTIEAAGFYGEVPDETGKRFKSVFVFAKLEGPLVEFEFANISGLTGGFGYNSHLNFPGAAEIMDFPFVSSSNLEGDPMTTLKTLAAGLKVDSCQVLAISAVTIVKWENGGLKLEIVGLGSATLPPSSKTVFGLIELGITATIDFAEGMFRTESQLSPRSFVLDTNCHPTGGSALCYWFAPNVLRGDWVFTLGGYHRAYQAPTHYPRPPRLGISWTVSDVLTITGEAYVAITPATCMAGSRLHAALRKGTLYTYFGTHAEMLINFKPFYFVTEMRVSVGVVYTQDLLFTSVPIKTEIGADLTLYGPPVAGRVWVNFWVFHFAVDFGPSENGKPHVIRLLDFYRLAL